MLSCAGWQPQPWLLPQSYLVDDSNNDRSDSAWVKPKNLAGAVSLVYHQYRVSGPGLNNIHGDVVVAGFLALQVELIHDEQFVSLQVGNLDRRDHRADDLPDVHVQVPSGSVCHSAED
jgi:hypothetical protein